MESNLTGHYRVARMGNAVKEGYRLLPKEGDRGLLRRIVLNLRWWPKTGVDEDQVIDLDWTYVKACPGLNIGEFRVNETIDGHDNLRAFFWVAPKREADPLPIIWILHVIQKKTNDVWSQTVELCKARRPILLERFYGA